MAIELAVRVLNLTLEMWAENTPNLSKVRNREKMASSQGKPERRYGTNDVRKDSIIPMKSYLISMT